jgi:exoribonuclease II
MTMILEGSLVLYKLRPARVTRLGEKLDIELEGGETQKVRPKDVALLHPGPIKTLAEALRPQQGEIATAWEMLAGSTTTLPDLAELAYGKFTPATAWAAWQLVAEGLYFRGAPDEIVACTAEDVARTKAARAADFAEKQAWAVFVGHVRTGHTESSDVRYLREIETVALGRAARSRVLRDLEREETPEAAHALLLDLGYWTPAVNPYPSRLEAATTQPDLPLPPLPDEPRRDLTHLAALAIDDATTDMPDDALSYEEGRLWVHVADTAAIVSPYSPLDLEARGRGASLYLPEGAVHMLPPAATPLLALGLSEVSPALSFGLDVTSDGRVIAAEIVPSWVRVTRLTYEETTARIAEAPLSDLYRLANAYLARREKAGAISIHLPEVDIRVAAGEVTLHLVASQPSRVLVENAMIMTGEAVAAYALERGIPMPFSTQEPPDETNDERRKTKDDFIKSSSSVVIGPSSSVSLSAMFALRKTFKRSQYRAAPAPHSGLGLAAYTQATSPMRRYLDLVAHQQVRAYLRGEHLLSADEILERVGATEAAVGAVRQAERLSNQHWTLVYLLQHEGWRGDGVLVERRDRNSVVLIPELGWETHMLVPSDLPLDSVLHLKSTQVDLPRLDARYKVIRDA